MADDLEARIEALEHAVSALFAFSAEITAEARGVSPVRAIGDIGESVITWAGGVRSSNPDAFYDALVKLMKRAATVSQAIENVRTGRRR